MSPIQFALADPRPRLVPPRLVPPPRPLPYRLALPFITLLSLALWAALFRAGAFLVAAITG
jgi:hypothetical protein